MHQDSTPETAKEIVLWWEKRRLKYNLVYFLTSLTWLLLASIFVRSKLFFGFGLIVMTAVPANACYCLGWITEIVLRKGIHPLDLKIGPLFLGLGTVFTVAGLLLYGLLDILYKLL